MAAVLTALGNQVPNANITVLSAATGVIPPVTGFAFISYAGACAATLAQPTADGIHIYVFAGTAHDHTVTTPADGIQGTDDTATFGGSIGDYIHLYSFGGQYQMLDSTGITLSEV
jgi:hypothetical protein